MLGPGIDNVLNVVFIVGLLMLVVGCFFCFIARLFRICAVSIGIVLLAGDIGIGLVVVLFFGGGCARLLVIGIVFVFFWIIDRLRYSIFCLLAIQNSTTKMSLVLNSS